MGNWVSASFGYGIALPKGEDDEDENGYEYTPTGWVSSVQPHYWDSDEEDVDWYIVAEALGLHYDAGYVLDYGHRSVIFGAKPLTTYDTLKSFTTTEVSDSVNYAGNMNEVLKEAAEKIGIPFEPAYFLVVSYG